MKQSYSVAPLSHLISTLTFPSNYPLRVGKSIGVLCSKTLVPKKDLLIGLTIEANLEIGFSILGRVFFWVETSSAQFKACARLHQWSKKKLHSMSPHNTWHSSALANFLAWLYSILLWGVCPCYIMVYKVTKVYINDTWQ